MPSRGDSHNHGDASAVVWALTPACGYASKDMSTDDQLRNGESLAKPKPTEVYTARSFGAPDAAELAGAEDRADT